MTGSGGGCAGVIIGTVATVLVVPARRASGVVRGVRMVTVEAIR